jgi:hypothetical protein
MPVMPRAAARTAAVDDPVAAAKARARAAHASAKQADPARAALYDMLWSHVLIVAEGQDDVPAATMLTRVAIALEVMADRTGWPHVIRGLTSAARPGARR